MNDIYDMSDDIAYLERKIQLAMELEKKHPDRVVPGGLERLKKMRALLEEANRIYLAERAKPNEDAKVRGLMHHMAILDEKNLAEDKPKKN